MAAGAAGCLVWIVPLLVLTGGVSGYLRALGSQAGEDFAWVDMLWSNPTPRLLALALYRTLAVPWGDAWLGAFVTALAAIGFVTAARCAPRMLGVVAVAFAPYAVFHLLLQETATIRYALPVLLPVIWLAVWAMSLARRAGILLWATTAVSALLLSVPTGIDYGQQAHPAFRAIVDMISEGEGTPPAGVYSHFALYRSLQFAAPDWLAAVPPERQREWLGPVRYFRDGGIRTVWFLGDPLRTDLALFDPASVQANEVNPWRAYAHPEMGGARPSGALWHRIQPPGWMAGEGWSLTPEAGGRVRATRTGLDHRPIEAYVRRRPQPATFYLGGFHLGAPTDAPAELTVALDGHPVDAWTIGPDQAGQPFLRFVTLPAGVPAGPGAYATLTVSARAGHARPPGARDRGPPVRSAARRAASADGVRRGVARRRVRRRHRPALALDQRACAVAARFATNGRAANPRRIAAQVRRRTADGARVGWRAPAGHFPAIRRLFLACHRSRRRAGRVERRRHH